MCVYYCIQYYFKTYFCVSWWSFDAQSQWQLSLKLRLSLSLLQYAGKFNKCLFLIVLCTPCRPLLTWLLVLHFQPILSLNLCSVSSILSLVNNLLSFLFLHVLLLSLSPLLFALSVSPVIATPVRSFLPLHAPSLPLLSSPPGSEVWLPLLPLSSPASPSLCQLQHRWVSAACVHVCLWRSSI